MANISCKEIGNFLIKNSEQLEEKFKTDRQYGTLSVVPNFFKFIENEFLKFRNNNSLQENKNKKTITVNEIKKLIKNAIKEGYEDLSNNYIMFATFNNGNVKLTKNFKLLPGRYIKVGNNDPVPIEDYGDWKLFKHEVTEDEAYQLFLNNLD